MRFHRKGKFFYLLLGALIAFVNVPMVIVLILSQQALTASHSQLQSILNDVLPVQLNYIQGSNPGRNHADQLAALRGYSFLEELGENGILEYGEAVHEAEKILLDATTSESENGQITTYIYFARSNYLIDSSNLGGNAVEDARPLIFEAINGHDATDTGTTQAMFYGGTGGDGEACTVTTSSIFPNVIFIFYIYFPQYPVSGRADHLLSEDFTASLKDVEICYYDSYGNARATTQAHDLAYAYDFYSLGPDENGYFLFSQSRHHYLCYYVYNDHNQSKFAVFFRDEIAEGLSVASTLLWVSGALLTVSCVFCAFLYVRRTYEPVNSLVSRLDNDADKRGTGLRDDFMVINEAITAFDDSLGRRDQLLRKFYLLRILRGQKTGNLEEFQDDWLFTQSACSFLVAAIHVDEADDGNSYDEGRIESVSCLFLKNEGWDIRTVTDNDFLFIVFRLPKDFSSEELVDSFRRLQKELHGFCISIYISDTHNSSRELRRCHSEAMAVSEHYIANGSIGIIATHDSLPKWGIREGVAAPDYSQLRKLSDCITSLSVDDALLIFDEHVSAFSQTWGRELGAEDIIYDVLANTITLAFFDIDISGDITKTTIASCVSQIRAAQTPHELRSRMQEYLLLFVKQSERQDLQLNRFEKIRQYVQENYTNSDLDSAMIAEKFKTSPSTITRLFKKYQGTGFLEHVNQLRVLKATQLLKNTDLPIAEIAGLVGYTNTVTMNRAFKTHTKSTPGMIRKTPYQ